MVRPFTRFSSILFACFLFACNTPPVKEKVRHSNSNELYLDYRATGDEESGNVVVRLQYRLGGPEGDAVLPASPARVQWDGQVIRPDSSKLNGPYYEKIIPLNNFSRHQVIFTSIDGKAFETPLDFPFFKLDKELPARIGRADLIIRVDGPEDLDQLQVLMTDTSFYGKGIDRVYPVKKGELYIPKTHLDALKRGPIYLELIREEDRILEQTPPGGGVLSLSYALKRELMLVDSL